MRNTQTRWTSVPPFIYGRRLDLFSSHNGAVNSNQYEGQGKEHTLFFFRQMQLWRCRLSPMACRLIAE
ncbi:unnamed protein product, partial [Mesorhabditis spiculigera]